ncbi:MAG: 1-acyl-sn-glycerol-3-phosphate acyltransferase, partial [Myxococcales bacterium]|nr:1-acyl-sn-glycerol-3-phosphate acyltransferase [Myxococcales bacterium]
AFLVFFVGAFVISWIMVPLLSLTFDREVRRRRFKGMARFATRGFVRYCRMIRMVDIRWSPLPAGFPEGGYVMIANHPTLIDVTIVMERFPELSTVVGRKWFAKPSLGRMIEAAGWIPASSPDDDDDGTPTLDAMVETLRAGTPMIIFPEGTRSDKDRLRRFHRGAIEAAIRAEVPIVPLFIGPNQPLLMRGQHWYETHHGVAVYTLELWPIIETAGADLDPREVSRELFARYKARFARLLAERDAAEALREGRAPEALPPADEPRHVSAEEAPR